MQVTVALEARYVVARDGSVWSQTGMARAFWQRYLEVFDRVVVVARAAPVNMPPDRWLRVDGDGVLFQGVPDYHGPQEYLRKYWEVRAAIEAAVPRVGSVILRVPSEVGSGLERVLRARAYPYGLEVVGDPYDVFAPGAVAHPLRPAFRWYFSRRLRKQCQRAVGVAYVTQLKLQARYPARSTGGGGYSTSYSSVELDEACFVQAPPRRKDRSRVQLVTVGSLAQPYKGVDVLIGAVARCVRRGLDLAVVVVGDGKYRQELMCRAERAQLGARIRFAGQVATGRAVREILDESDVFVLASRTEGLPRAMIEAMARGLPCIGTAVGGIPELLGGDEMIPASDEVALAAKISEVVHSPERMDAMARSNLAKARSYSEGILAKRRQHFYEYLQSYIRDWESTTKAAGRHRLKSETSARFRPGRSGGSNG